MAIPGDSWYFYLSPDGGEHAIEGLAQRLTRSFLRRGIITAEQTEWCAYILECKLDQWSAFAVMAVVGTVLPPITILSVISLFYAAFAANPYVALVLKGMQAGVAAVILDVVWGLGANVVKTKSAIHMVVMAAAFLATFVYGVNVIYIILAAGLLGVVLAMVQRKKGGKLQ